MPKLKGKKKWLSLAVALALVAVEVIAPNLSPLAELIADVVDPLPAEDESRAEQWAGDAPEASKRCASSLSKSPPIPCLVHPLASPTS